MAEQENRPVNNCRNGVDVFTLIAGIATLCVSGYILADGPQWLTGMELRWLLAGGAVLVGALMLIASVRGGRRNNGSDKPPR